MAILEGDEEIFLTTKHSIQNSLESIPFTLDPRGFVQTNQKVALKLYETAGQWVKELKIHSLTELFSGQGAFSFFCAPYVEEAFGVEINQSAVRQANELSQQLKTSHLSFIASDAKDVENEIKKLGPDLILVNPPRSGLKESIKILKENTPKHLIYSSCSPETLSKDLMELKEIYQIKKCQIFDMFPHTEHFEVLVLLEALPKA